MLANVQPPSGDPVPEPQMILVMMFGITAIFWMCRRRATASDH